MHTKYIIRTNPKNELETYGPVDDYVHAFDLAGELNQSVKGNRNHLVINESELKSVIANPNQWPTPLSEEDYLKSNEKLKFSPTPKNTNMFQNLLNKIEEFRATHLTENNKPKI